MSTHIAIVGMACRYPDARSPKELWENVLSKRRAFRRLPPERISLADYWSADKTAPDRFYAPNAALIEGYEFDRVGFKVAGSTYRSTDLTHWLALDVASQALADAGFPDGEGLPRTGTAVIIGNTLTGEFTRSNLLRLRWPYVRRTVAATLRERGWADDQLMDVLETLEERFKEPFPPVDEDTLAGGLSNTIAGRICNYFDLKGGGYTVDGACSSSLLSVSTACKALVDGDADMAIAGGVDLSIDPFELVGFAKTGALAPEEMRVYDRRSAGFWPGEGCGMLVLAREEDARARGHHIYALIVGWGISSDGRGGITRPEVGGQQLALGRAYSRAGFGADTVGYFEGHGTGTAVGDPVEIKAISLARRSANPHVPPAVISTVKANIGHTKAAAGVAGLIKATMAIDQQVIPPTTGCDDPHPALSADGSALRVAPYAEPWPADRPIRAAVSSMGFGGINTHVVLEHSGGERRERLHPRTRTLLGSVQDAELLAFDATVLADLRYRLAAAADLTPRLSFAELADLAAGLERELDDRPLRAVIVADRPAQARDRLVRLLELLDSGIRSVIDTENGIFLGRVTRPPRVAFAFPGQGSGRTSDGGALRRRFELVDELYTSVDLPTDGDQVATAVAQPRIVTGSLAGLRVLDELGITADVALGHSLGELTALRWAGAFDSAALVRIAAERGRIMTELSRSGGAMASIVAGPDEVAQLLAEEPVVIAGLNSPEQTVISGPADAVERVGAYAEVKNMHWSRLPVSHAFHSPLVEPAAATFAEYLAGEAFNPLERTVVSSVTGAALAADVDVRELLREQVTAPVRFADAVAEATADVDLVIEVGPGRVLSGLVSETAPVPVVAMETDGMSVAGLLRAVAAAYVLGVPVRHAALFDGRHTKALPEKFHFLANACEAAPEVDVAQVVRQTEPAAKTTTAQPAAEAAEREATEALLRRLAAERAELPPEAVHSESRLLDDLHLSSITVGQIVNEAIRVLELPQPANPLNFATATVREVAQALDELAAGGHQTVSQVVLGVEPWIRAFSIEMVETPRPAAPSMGTPGTWRLFAAETHPIAEALQRALEDAGIGDGVLVCLPAAYDERQAGMLLAGARAALGSGSPGRFVIVGRGGAAVVKTLHMEASIPACVIDVPLVPEAIAWVVAEAAATSGFTEVTYDHAGVRRVPVLEQLPAPAGEAGEAPIGDGDVLLVTGGGKGITAECALAIARDTGARVALLGRSAPEDEEELADNLERFEAAGVTYKYVRADVTLADDVRRAVADVQESLGPITALLHGSGRNVPQGLGTLDEEEFQRTLAPKIGGLRTVLAAIDPEALRLMITFGSIIGRAGLPGEAHYATANAWMTDQTVEFGATYPDCRTVALEWSVWSGVGMGERLGVVESLQRAGITPISPDDGIAILRRVLTDPTTPTVLVVTGRVDGLPTVAVNRPETPLRRFVDRSLVYYPGIELISEAELTTAGDPYLEDHDLDGNLLFPAVLGMEAMTQVATVVSGHDTLPVLENLEFMRPIVVPAYGSTTIRVAALVRDDETVETVIRSDETGYQVDHFRATCRFSREGGSAPRSTVLDLPRIAVDPARELYGGILFQGKRFQRLLGYRRIGARYCVADIGCPERDNWFGVFLPGTLLLGDPGVRDVFMHAIQSCRPDQTLLPVSVDRIEPADLTCSQLSGLTMYGAERAREGDGVVWDLEIRDEAGTVVERWDALRLRVVRTRDNRGSWLAPLLGPYLERRLEEVFPGKQLDVVVEVDGAGEVDWTEVALSRALGRAAVVRHRPDGKPEVDDGPDVSVAHGAGLTLALAGTGRLAVDVEPVVIRSDEEWKSLLGPDRHALALLLAREYGEDESVASTRVWCAAECAQKAGRPAGDPLTLVAYAPDGGAVLAAGSARIGTFVAELRHRDGPVVFAVRAGEEP